MEFQHGDRVWHTRRRAYGTYSRTAAPDTAYVEFDGYYDDLEVTSDLLVPAADADKARS
jgi:hypothetical protein